MTSTSKGYPPDSNGESEDLLAKISMASTLEQAGHTNDARLLYQEVVAADPSGTIGASARRALEVMKASEVEEVTSVDAQISFADSFGVSANSKKYIPTTRGDDPDSSGQQRKLRLLQRLYNLPISHKQLGALILSELLTLGLVGISAVVLRQNCYSQLARQAESELAATQLAYDNKVNQIAIDFSEQSDDSAIIAAAKTSQLSPTLRYQVKVALFNEINKLNIEYATLVGRDSRIIASANSERQGEVFDPHQLVSKVLQKGLQIRQTEIVTAAELEKEKPRLPAGFANQDALIRYIVTPVKDPVSQAVTGALVAGDIVNNKLPIVETTIKSLAGGYSAVYMYGAKGEFVLATSQEQQGKELPFGVPLPNTDLLTRAVNAKGKTVTGRGAIGGNSYMMAARSLPNSEGEPTAILVRGTPEAGLHKLLSKNMWLLLVLALVATALNILIFIALNKAIAEPIEQFLEAARKYFKGNKSSRAEIFADDEVGQLALCFNQMAQTINISESIRTEQAIQRQSELDFQRRVNERLQQGVIQLLLDIEGAKLGDLTVRATVDDGEMGSIADAFNATIQSLSQLVTQVQTATYQVHESAFNSEASVRRLSQEATSQANVISVTLNSVAEMAQSIHSVADSAQEAAVIARKALLAAQEGWETMDETVRSIQNIRTSVAETSKKVKRLAESSQEIYKIVSIISGISEKTNLLAFNASIEAARAGKNGQGFRVVADEVRRLAERVTNSTKEIEQLVTTIQQETAEVLQTMEQSTKQVVTGTKLVGKTKQTLENLAVISQKIDQLLQSISVSTVSQTQASKMVKQTMEEVAAIAKNTSSESEAVSSALQALVAVAEELQGYVAKFRVENQ